MSSHYLPRIMYRADDEFGPIVGLGITERGRVIVATERAIFELMFVPDASDFHASFPDSTAAAD